MLLTRRQLVLAAAADRQETFRSEANLVLVRFSVLRGREFITDLTAKDVVVAEDGQAKTVALFEGPLSAGQADQPVDFRVMVDLSGSAQRFQTLTGQLLSRTLIGSTRRQASVTLYGFAFDCRKLAGPTRDPAELNDGIRRLSIVDVRREMPAASRIFESVVQVAHDPALSSHRLHPVLVIFSDGMSSGSRLTLHDAVDAARRVGLTVFPILLANPADRDGRDEHLIEEYAKMGEATGGRSFWPAAFTTEHVDRILGHIAAQVRAGYTVGYYRAPADAGGRAVRVKLKDHRKGVSVRRRPS